jgi:hypothetical protein
MAQGAVPCLGALQFRLVQRLALGHQPVPGGDLVAGLGALLEVAHQFRLVQRPVLGRQPLPGGQGAGTTGASRATRDRTAGATD